MLSQVKKIQQHWMNQRCNKERRCIHLVFAQRACQATRAKSSTLVKPMGHLEASVYLSDHCLESMQGCREEVIQDRLNLRLSKQVSIRKLNGYFRAINDRLNRQSTTGRTDAHAEMCPTATATSSWWAIYMASHTQEHLQAIQELSDHIFNL